MATIKYRANASSSWQRVWVRITNFASEIFTSRGKTVEQELDELSNVKSIVSDEWNNTTTYAAGDYRIENNALYKCLITNSGQRPSVSPTYWKASRITDFAPKVVYSQSLPSIALNNVTSPTQVYVIQEEGLYLISWSGIGSFNRLILVGSDLYDVSPAGSGTIIYQVNAGVAISISLNGGTGELLRHRISIVKLS